MLKPKWKCKKISTEFTALQFIGWQKMGSWTTKITHIGLLVVKTWIDHHSTNNYSGKHVIQLSMYPRVPNRVPRYPNMGPWDQNLFWSRIPIKLWYFFILYIFQYSKLFWKNHATSDQKKSCSMRILQGGSFEWNPPRNF